MSAIILPSELSFSAVVSFQYPIDNRIRVSTRLLRRRFVVESVRDCDTEPIEPWAIMLRPLLRRGRLLVTGHDLDRFGVRSFYVNSMRSLRLLSQRTFRLAVYDPCDESKFEWFGCVFTDSLSDRKLMRDIISRINQANDQLDRPSRLSIGAFPFPGDRP